MTPSDPRTIAAQIDAEIRSLPAITTARVRAVRRRYSSKLKDAGAKFMLDLATILIEAYGHRWLAYELIRYHQAAFQSIGETELEAFGQGIDSWDRVDAFARILAGPAWLRGQISDELIHRWAVSPDRWWRRAALVSTVALNMRSHGGKGDVARTLAVCRRLVADRDDMVAKAMSWALRELIVHDVAALEAFLAAHESTLPARVKREVRNKLTTGLKYPKRRTD